MLAACTITQKAIIRSGERDVILLNPEDGISTHWEHQGLKKRNTLYERVKTDLGTTIRATGNVSASILYRMFEPIDLNCDKLGWSWYVYEPQATSNLRIKGEDDVAASLFVFFGDPGMFRDKPVPTLRYAWANQKHHVDEIIKGPYHEEFLRTIIVRIGKPERQEMIDEDRNLIEDFMRAFGDVPGSGIHGIAIFTDNDDTGEAIEAHYGMVSLICDQL